MVEVEFQRGQDWVTVLPVRSWVISEATFQLDTMDVSMVEISRSVIQHTSTSIPSSVQHSHFAQSHSTTRVRSKENVPIGEV